MNASAKRFSKAGAKAHSKKAVPPHREEDSLRARLQSTAKSAGITLGIGALLLLAATLALYFSPDPNPLIRPLGLLAAALTALLGGMIAIRIHKTAPLPCGLLNGSAVMAIMMVLSLFLGNYASALSATLAALLHVAFLLLSVLGACIGRKRPKAPTRRRR